MAISRLRVGRLRNILDAEMHLARVNVICGANGSGKTSILESVYLLGTGRSFRATRLDPVINHGSEQCTVHGLIEEKEGSATASLGVSRHRDGSFDGRIQGETIRNAADLARRLPVQLINSGTFGLLEGAPKVRRQFLDWGVFHVEHGFHQIWMDVHRSLRQRNALLRHDRIAATQMDAWNARLIEGAERIDALRAHYFEAFYPVFTSTLAELTRLEGLEFHYQRGWDRERSLGAVLADQLDRDRERGFTHSGPHRADLRVRVRGMAADQVLSRGQQKLVVCAMKLAQARLFQDMEGRECVFLIDDLPAELDRVHRRQLCGLLGRMGCQVLVSCVDADDLAECWSDLAPDSIRMFHVEQGKFAHLN